MKKFFMLIAALVPFLMTPSRAIAQDGVQVEWSAHTEQVKGDIWRVVITGSVPQGYHIYDTKEYEYGANPTIMEFTVDGKAVKSGPLQILSEVDEYYDDILEFELGTMSGQAVFAQDFKVRGDRSEVTIDIEWMMCDDTSCTPLQDETLSVVLEGEGGGFPIVPVICVILLLVAGAIVIKRKK